eukprot:scaffold84635_cov57-Phaeocystis_antarctica.AAC.1
MLHIIQGKFTRSLWQPIPVRMPTAVFDTADVIATTLNSPLASPAARPGAKRRLSGVSERGCAAAGAAGQEQGGPPRSDPPARQ